jgi:hypothetical protein
MRMLHWTQQTHYRAISRQELTGGRGGGGWVEPNKRLRESLAIYKSFNTLWFSVRLMAVAEFIEPGYKVNYGTGLHGWRAGTTTICRS